MKNTTVAPLVITEAKQETSVEKKAFTKKEILEKAAVKLLSFWIDQKDLISVSWLEPTEDKSWVLWVIIKWFIKEWNSLSTLLVNFYTNWNVSYIVSSGKRNDREFTKVTKKEFSILVKSRIQSTDVYDTF